jgi:hypothetical protein
MTARENFGRRLHDFNPAQAAVEILRVCPLTPQDFQAVVNALALRASTFDGEGWFGMDCVEWSLIDAADDLETVRGPGNDCEGCAGSGDNRHNGSVCIGCHGRGVTA